MDCDFCHRKFGTKGTLLRHQQTAKFCIKIQYELKPKTNVFICNGCNKELSTKQKLQSHHRICDKYIENIRVNQLEKTIEIKDSIINQDKATIEELKNRIRELELDIKDIALKSKGKTTTNSNTYIYQNFTPITDEKLKENAINFTKEHLELGGRGVAKYALENVLKNNFVCTDPARGNVKYLDNSGELVIDPGATTIARRVCSSIVEPAEKINRSVKSTLSGETDDEDLIKAVLIDETVNDIREVSNGVENELSKEFTRTVSTNNVKKVCV